MTESHEPHRRYAEALLFAIEKHRIQTRRDGTPYIAHPIRVAESLRTIGGIQDEDVVIAGLLHDLIEDTETDFDGIESRFGPRVAGLVAEMTADMRLPKQERRRQQVIHIRTASREAKTIKLADRYDNLTDMNGFSEKRKLEYIAHSREVLAACTGANPGLEAALANAIRALEARG